MAITRRGTSTVYIGTLAEFNASTRTFPFGSVLMPKDSNQVRISNGKQKFSLLTQIPTAAINKAPLVASLANPATLTAIGAVFADLGAARIAVNTLKTEVEARLTASDNKINALIQALKDAGLMLSA